MKYYLRRETIERIIDRQDKREKWLAEQLGIHIVTLSRVMNGHSHVSPELRQRFMELFRRRRISWDELFRLAEETMTSSGPD